MQLPAGKAIELLQRLGGFEGEQKLAQLVGHRERHRLGVSVFIELPQPFVAKGGQVAMLSLHYSCMYGYAVHVKRFISQCRSVG
jgi:hypothetical protein